MVALSTQAFADETYYSDQTVAYVKGIAKLNSLQVASENQLEKEFWWGSDACEQYGVRSRRMCHRH